MVAAVADIRNLEPHIRRELALNAKVERLAISQFEGSRIDGDRWEYTRRGIAARVHLIDNTRIVARSAWAIPIEVVCLIRSQLRSKTARDTLVERHAHRIVNKPKRGANHGLGLQLVSKTKRGSKLPRVLVLL